MNIGLDLKLLVLVCVANALPVLANTLFGKRLSYPVDGDVRLADGQPLLGRSKSVRGIVFSVAAAAAMAPLLGMAWYTGATVAAAAMLGDLFSSFLKRRMKMPASSMAIGLDQVPESLLPALVSAWFVRLTAWDIVAVTACFFVLELSVSRVLFRLRLRDRPY